MSGRKRGMADEPAVPVEHGNLDLDRLGKLAGQQRLTGRLSGRRQAA